MKRTLCPGLAKMTTTVGSLRTPLMTNQFSLNQLSTHRSALLLAHVASCPARNAAPPPTHVAHSRVPPPFPWLMLLPVTCRRDGLRSQRPPVISFARTAGVMLHPGICGRNCSPCDRLWSTSSRPFTNRAHIDSFDEWLTVLSIGVYYRLILLKSLFRSIVLSTIRVA